jgi:hypothetical protein
MASERRPLFANDFPRVPELDAIVGAFSRGDYARVRKDAEDLAESAQSESVRQAARTLVSRTAPDPLAVWLLVLSAAFVVTVSAYWIVHGKSP